MYNLIKPSVMLLCLTLLSTHSFGQCIDGKDINTGQDCNNVITTALPFLRINTDARSAGMGDVGIATPATAQTIQFNTSRIIFSEKEYGVAVSYTPWLRNLGIDDIFIANLSGFKKLDERQAVAVDLKYFSLGNINFTDADGNSLGSGKPREFSIGASYVRKFSDVLSGGLTAKYIRSRIANDVPVPGASDETINPINTFAVDLSVSTESEISLGGNDATLLFGGTISNLGPKVTYTTEENEDFIPTNLGLGVGLNMALDDVNEFTTSLEFNKLLVPSPTYDDDGAVVKNEDSFVSGMFGSFGDAPGGFSEELREITAGIGAEYVYDKQFAVRAGYFFEAETKGNRKFFTVGAGVKYQIVGINFSYLIPSGQQSPLDNTIRFGLVFDFDSAGASISSDQL